MKKSEYITSRTNQEAKEFLEAYAAEKKWTISFLVQEIIQEWVQKHKDAPKE